MKTSSAKSKGRRLQQFICREIASLLGFDYNQQDDQCMIRSREMGQSGTDVILRNKARELFPFSIEAKNQERLNLWKAVEQAMANEQENTDWMLVCKKNKSDPVVVISWGAFMKWFGKKGYLL